MDLDDQYRGAGVGRLSPVGVCRVDQSRLKTLLHAKRSGAIIAMASGAQTERRGVPRPVRLLRGSEDAPAEFFPILCSASESLL